MAIKIYTYHDEKTKREIESLTTLPSHRNVIKLLGPIVGYRSQLIGLVLELMDRSLHNGELSESYKIKLSIDKK